MSPPRPSLCRAFASLVLACLLPTLTSAPALAEPPAHAKAHGWRKKNDPSYPGYTGRKWTQDYGIVSTGRCNTDAVLMAVGGVAGGVIGSQVSNSSDRTVAIIVGSAIGAVAGYQFGKHIDRTDQACIGHTLELAPNNKPVRWTNAQTGVSYNLVPTGTDSRNCRTFRLEASAGGKKDTAQRIACPGGDGRWELRG